MDRTLSIPIGVVVAREKIDHPWQEYSWRPVSVFLNAPETTEWRELRRGEGFTHYHAATVDLELHRKETEGYLENLADPPPTVYVILRESDEDDGDDPRWPVTVHLATASGYEIQAYGEEGSEIIGQVEMPEPLVALLTQFISEHHVEEPFFKRKRKKYVQEEDHHFGQEPLVELRARMSQAEAAKPPRDDGGEDRGSGRGKKGKADE